MQLRCIECSATYDPRDVRTACTCGGLLEVALPTPDITRETLDSRLGALDVPLHSGVWRFRELMPSLPDEAIVSMPEGNTNLYQDSRLDDVAGTRIYFKHEGENPTGSFKDRGMTVGISHAKWVGARIVACASTGNTSASVAAYAARAGLPAVVFIPAGNISAAKLGQTLAYGPTVIQVHGDFDAAMEMVQAGSREHGLYLLNSLNPFRLEGQKSIVLEALQQLHWQMPDWIVIPGGNLGNTSALGKALREAYAAGLISQMPRIAVVQAAGAAPFAKAFDEKFASFAPVVANTRATAIRIGNPVNYAKARRVIVDFEGTVLAVSDDEIMAAKRAIDGVGIGCEPASAAGLAGIRRLVADGTIAPGETVLTYLTGHVLKDGDANADLYLNDASRILQIEPDAGSLAQAMEQVHGRV